MKAFLAALLSAALAAAPVAMAPARAQEQVLSVQDADIRAFIQDIARTTGSTFIIDPRVRGTVSVASNGPLSRTELFEVFLSTLRANGLVAVPTGAGAYRIAPAEGVAQQPSGPGAVRFSTEVFRLRSIEAGPALNLVKPLVGAQGQAIASTQGNILVVADYADNLTRIRALITQIDQDRSEIRAVTLRFSSAREIAAALNDMMAAGGGQGAARNGLVVITPVESSNSVILRGQPEALQRLLPVIADLDQRAEARDSVRVIRLQNADAEQILPVLQQVLGQAVTAVGPSTSSSGSPAARLLGGSATPAVQTTSAGAAPSGQPGAAEARIARYPGANALVISAPPELQRTLAEVIRQLDVRREQVLVEAIVVEVSDTVAKQLGVQFVIGDGRGNAPFAATNFSSGPSIIGLAGAIAGGGVLPPGTIDQLRQGAVNSLAGTNGGIGGFGGPIGQSGLFGVIIDAVKRDTGSNLLSTPSILTLDNEEARILVGQEIPITTGEVLGDSNANPFRTVQRKDVGIQLEVRPQITAGGAVSLQLRQEVSSVAGPISVGSSELITNTREIETRVLVDDGDIVVLGGLLSRDERVTVEKVPGLGDIPGLGGLFRSKGREGARTNLMVFIRPTIVRSPDQAQAATAQRYEVMRREQAATSKTGESSLDELVRDYMRTAPPAVPPIATAPLPAAVAP